MTATPLPNDLTDAQRNAVLVAMNHRLRCVPAETITEGPKAGRYFHRLDLDPGINGPGCVCGAQPLKVRPNDPDFIPRMLREQDARAQAAKAVAA